MAKTQGCWVGILAVWALWRRLLSFPVVFVYWLGLQVEPASWDIGSIPQDWKTPVTGAVKLPFFFFYFFAVIVPGVRKAWMCIYSGFDMLWNICTVLVMTHKFPYETYCMVHFIYICIYSFPLKLKCFTPLVRPNPWQAWKGFDPRSYYTLHFFLLK